jgi:polyhydroxyalkanoate synthesis repressor PhaR
MPTTRKASAPAPAPEGDALGPVRVLKKYPNRRLYDTQTSSYITLADVKLMVLGGESFEVRDAKTAEDLTRSILLQIILEEESGGVPMFTAVTLSQIIRFYGHAMQGAMGSMLEQNMQAFAELQKNFMGQSVGMVDPKRLSPDAWSQFLGAQPQALQGLMGSYVEQGRALLEKMQEAGQMFPGMAGFPPGKK